VRFQPRQELREAELLKLINTPSAQIANRVTAALELSYLRHVLAGGTIPLSCLTVGDRLRILHFPGEPFVEYQLFAQREATWRFVAVAGYSDGGPGYLPLARSYEEGGYEPTQAFVGPETEALLKASVARLVK
jgi:hypothetical protein